MISRRGQESWFVTLTFKSFVTTVWAQKHRDRWLARLRASLVDSGGGRLKWVCATEWQVRDVVHYHLIVSAWGLHSQSRKSWEERWKANGGGFSRIYDAVLKAAPYLAKYLNKRLGGELQMGGSWLGLTVPASVSCSCQGPETV